LRVAAVTVEKTEGWGSAAAVAAAAAVDVVAVTDAAGCV